VTNQGLIDILPGNPQQLLFGYDIVNNPANPTGGFYKINGLQFFYQNSASPISLRVTITETAANFLASGAALTGSANYELNGTPAAGNSLTTSILFQGTNPLLFPTAR